MTDASIADMQQAEGLQQVEKGFAICRSSQ